MLYHWGFICREHQSEWIIISAAAYTLIYLDIPLFCYFQKKPASVYHSLILPTIKTLHSVSDPETITGDITMKSGSCSPEILHLARRRTCK